MIFAISAIFVIFVIFVILVRPLVSALDIVASVACLSFICYFRYISHLPQYSTDVLVSIVVLHLRAFLNISQIQTDTDPYLVLRSLRSTFAFLRSNQHHFYLNAVWRINNWKGAYQIGLLERLNCHIYCCDDWGSLRVSIPFKLRITFDCILEEAVVIKLRVDVLRTFWTITFQKKTVWTLKNFNWIRLIAEK